MSPEQFSVESKIEEALDGLTLEEQRNFLQDIVSYADNLLDKVKEEIEEEESGESDSDLDDYNAIEQD